jgi:excisionase family DNA binding protein
VTDRLLEAAFTPDLLAAIERLVDERVEQRVRERDEPTSRWLTIPEAAKYARVSTRTFQRLLTKKQVRATSVGRRSVVDRHEVDRYLEATAGDDVAPTTPPRRRMA